ncbi:rho GTPase-activating protein 44 isoform X11 [Syngnathus scovelli]|uniref:rho GTPase-activating protein 44 isoform X11 n=1 Tax=Syngnathus scovelli TaxID=161590 RepID=UPI00210FB90D|nr:rho GTPase-activating protein 44 isoform X3 [Syngnathus scovelli]
MKKQFNRMRQLANQTVGRAEKTEVLSEDLLQVEKRLDLVKQVTHSAHKKLTACLQGHQGADVERKSLKSPSKKLPLSILAQCLAEGAAVLGDDALLGKMLKMCGEAEEKLAQELMDFELQVEQDVVEPLSTLAEVDIPNIQKQRKHLAKLVLDMDSSRTRYQQSSKSSSHPGTLQPGAKSDSLREEMEDAATRMEICKDQLSADMYAFAAKEVDYANYFQTLMETQAEYHSKSLEILTAILPQIRAHQEAWLEKPSFGKPLEEHLNISGREIAFPIEACVTALLECGLREEGLFRVAPSASKLKKLKASLDCGVLDAQEYSSDPHAIAGALKSYLRELPEPLMTMELYDEWIQASNIQDMDKRLQALMGTCAKLPTDNLNNFRYLVKFLAKLSEYQDYNKMTPGNMAIVLGPNLLWTHSEPDMTEVLTTLSLQMVGIIEPIIQHADWFFPGKMDFNLTGSYGSPVHVNYNCNYSSLPSPDTEQSERMRPHHDQSRRPLSVATDNMMLEFYKEKDGIRKIQSPAWACGSWILPGCRARARLRWPARAAAPRQGSAPRPPTRSPPPSRPPRQLPHRLSRRPPLRPPWKGSAQTCGPIGRTPLRPGRPQGRTGRPLPIMPPPTTTSTPSPLPAPVPRRRALSRSHRPRPRTTGQASHPRPHSRPPPLPPRPPRSTSIPTPSPAACTSPSTARPATVTHRRFSSNPPWCSPATSSASAIPPLRPRHGPPVPAPEREESQGRLVRPRVKSSPLSLATKASKRQVQQCSLAAVCRIAVRAPALESAARAAWAKVPKNWRPSLQRSRTISQWHCPTSPPGSRHQSANRPPRPARLPFTDCSALRVKRCHRAPRGSLSRGHPTPFPRCPRWPGRSPSHGPGRGPACPRRSRLSAWVVGTRAQSEPRRFSHRSRPSLTDCLRGRACQQISSTTKFPPSISTWTASSTSLAAPPAEGHRPPMRRSGWPPLYDMAQCQKPDGRMHRLASLAEKRKEGKGRMCIQNRRKKQNSRTAVPFGGKTRFELIPKLISIPPRFCLLVPECCVHGSFGFAFDAAASA